MYYDIFNSFIQVLAAVHRDNGLKSHKQVQSIHRFSRCCCHFYYVPRFISAIHFISCIYTLVTSDNIRFLITTFVDFNCKTRSIAYKWSFGQICQTRDIRVLILYYWVSVTIFTCHYDTYEYDFSYHEDTCEYDVSYHDDTHENNIYMS